MSINVTKGWPNGHASEMSYPVHTGVSVPEGAFVTLIDGGAGAPEWRLSVTGDLATDIMGQALDTNTTYGYDVRYAEKLPVVLKNYVAETDQFTGAAFAPGDLLSVDPAAPGKVHVQGVMELAIATVVEYDATAGLLTLARL